MSNIVQISGVRKGYGISKTVKLAVKAGVGIGAHPGLPDLMGFGRRILSVM